MSKTVAAGTVVLDAIFRGTGLHSEIWAALATSDGTEITSGNAARVRIHQDGATNPFVDAAADVGGLATCASNGAVTFPQGGGGAVAAKVLLYTASTGGTQVREMVMTEPLTWGDNVTIRFQTGTLVWTEE